MVMPARYNLIQVELHVPAAARGHGVPGLHSTREQYHTGAMAVTIRSQFAAYRYTVAIHRRHLPFWVSLSLPQSCYSSATAAIYFCVNHDGVEQVAATEAYDFDMMWRM